MRLSPYGIHLSNHLPAHATSTSKVLLAFFSVEEQKHWVHKFSLKRLTPFTIQQEDDFVKVLDHVSQQNFCLSQEEHELSVIAISVSILNPQRQIIAALNYISQTNKVTEQYLVNMVLPMLNNTVYEIRSIL